MIQGENGLVLYLARSRIKTEKYAICLVHATIITLHKYCRDPELTTGIYFPWNALPSRCVCRRPAQNGWSAGSERTWNGPAGSPTGCKSGPAPTHRSSPLDRRSFPHRSHTPFPPGPFQVTVPGVGPAAAPSGRGAGRRPPGGAGRCLL